MKRLKVSIQFNKGAQVDSLTAEIEGSTNYSDNAFERDKSYSWDDLVNAVKGLITEGLSESKEITNASNV